MKTIKVLIGILCWLTISPLFYFLAGRWKLAKERTFLMLISPLFLVLYCVIYIWVLCICGNIQRKYYFMNEDRIERITGVKLPEMSIIKYHKGRTSITGDYNDRIIVEFEDYIPDDLFQTLDSLIDTKKTEWRKNGPVYEFNLIWGGLMPVPKGEDDDAHRFFEITIEKGSNKATINNGVW